jgi:long-subunit acyl-CoA synthetase (AMP-forming)
MFKTSGGKYIAPQIIEHGKNLVLLNKCYWWRKNGAFIQTNFDFIKNAIHKFDIGSTNEEIYTMKVIARIKEEIDEINLKLDIGNKSNVLNSRQMFGL